MSETTNFLTSVSRIFTWLLPILSLVVIVFVILVLLELVKFLKKLETTNEKIDNLNSKVMQMQTTFGSSLEESEMFDMHSYRDLQFKSALANNVLGFGIDNSEEIIDWTQKFVRGYKRIKKKKKK